jgi:hypothetical protein
MASIPVAGVGALPFVGFPLAGLLRVGTQIPCYRPRTRGFHAKYDE